jgi:hypothetical protein
MKSNKRITNPSTGVVHPVAEDFCLVGDTRHPLATKSLPRRSGAHAEVVTTQGLHTNEQTVSLPGKGVSAPAGKGQIPDGQRYAYRTDRPATDNDE